MKKTNVYIHVYKIELKKIKVQKVTKKYVKFT